ncbi:10283_t:CDS:2, partial [Acaulospora colombiana]
MTFDLAAAYPHSTFIGLEIFPSHLSSPPPSPSSPSIEPPNATILQTHPLTSPQIPFPDECFDFVYFHSLMPTTELRDCTDGSRDNSREFEGWFRGRNAYCESQKDLRDRFHGEKGLVKDMIRVLKPNGWIEFMRIENMCACEFGSVTRKMINGYLGYIDASAIDTLNLKNSKSLLTSNKRLRNVTNESKDTLLGARGGRIGEL